MAIFNCYVSSPEGTADGSTFAPVSSTFVNFPGAPGAVLGLSDATAGLSCPGHRLFGCELHSGAEPKLQHDPKLRYSLWSLLGLYVVNPGKPSISIRAIEKPWQTVSHNQRVNHH